MPRKPNCPRFTTASNEPSGYLSWPIMDQVYPDTITFHTDQTSIEDPFGGAGSGRTATHTLITFANLSVIDVGWQLDAEGEPPFPVQGADIYPGLLIAFAENWAARGGASGTDPLANWKAWAALRSMLRWTIMGSLWLFAAQQRWPRWSRWVRIAGESKGWQFVAGIPVWFGEGSVDLLSVFDS